MFRSQLTTPDSKRGKRQQEYNSAPQEVCMRGPFVSAVFIVIAPAPLFAQPPAGGEHPGGWSDVAAIEVYG
jgi:hypothetical protein